MENYISEDYWYVYSRKGTSTFTSPTYITRANRDQAAQELADAGWKVELFERTQQSTGILKPDPRAKLRNADIGTLWEKQRPDYTEPVRYVKIDNNKFMRMIGLSFTYSTAEGVGFPERLTQVEEF